MFKDKLKGIVIGVVAVLILTAAVPALASSVTSAIQVTYRNIGVTVNGKSVVTEQEPFIFEGRTYLAVRDIAEAFGMEIRFNEITNTVEITAPQTSQTSPPAQSPPTQASPTPPAQTPPAQTSPTPPVGAATNRQQRPTNPSISRERSMEIAEDWLRQNGITGAWRDGGVSMDFERGRWVWEVEYELGRQEWDFYICVMTGEVVHVDID